jgi:hypothetical protein
MTQDMNSRQAMIENLRRELYGLISSCTQSQVSGTAYSSDKIVLKCTYNCEPIMQKVSTLIKDVKTNDLNTYKRIGSDILQIEKRFYARIVEQCKLRECPNYKQILWLQDLLKNSEILFLQNI